MSNEVKFTKNPDCDCPLCTHAVFSALEKWLKDGFHFVEAAEWDAREGEFCVRLDDDGDGGYEGWGDSLFAALRDALRQADVVP